MDFKKAMLLSLFIISSLSSFGCGGGDSAGVSIKQEQEIDEAVIRRLAHQMESSNIEERKEACLLEKLPGFAIYKTPLFDEQPSFQDDFFSQPLSFNNLSITNIRRDGDSASAAFSYQTEQDEQITETYRFVRIDGRWSLDPLVISSSKPLKAVGEDDRLEAAANLGFTHKDEPVIVLDVRSRTSTRYMVGWTEPASFTLITEDGEFPVQNADFFYAPGDSFAVSSAGPTRFTLPFRDATGAPRAIRVVGFNELNAQGLPLGADQAQVMTFTLSE